MSWKAALLTVALGGALLGTGVAAARADDRDEERRGREEWRLERDSAHHGYYSRQAERRRWRSRAWRDQCRPNARRYGWWDDRRWNSRHWRERDGDDDDEREGRHHRGWWRRRW